MAAVPLRSPEGGTIGTLAVSFREPHVFDEDELGILKGLADHAAIAITNTSLYERLRESEGRYRHLVQNSPDLVWSIDADSRFSFLSDTCERLTGWRPDELLGRHFGALVHEISRDVAEIDWTVGMTGPSQEIRGRLHLLHKDGHPIPAEFIAIGTMDPEGRFLGANGSVRDMTDLDRLERELRASEERYRNLLQSSPDLIFAADGEGRYTFVSDRIEELLGRQPDEVVGRHFSEFITESTLDIANAGYLGLVEDPRSIQRLRFSLIHADGRSIPYEVTALGSAGPDGRLIAVHGVARDISEQDRLERELRASEERYRFLVENSPDIIFSTDAEGRYTYYSDSVERLTGWRPDEMVGQHFTALVDIGHVRRRRARVEGVRRGSRADAGPPVRPADQARRSPPRRGQRDRDDRRGRQVRGHPRGRSRRQRAGAPGARAARVGGALPVPRPELAGHHLLDRRGRHVHVHQRHDRAAHRPVGRRARRAALLADRRRRLDAGGRGALAGSWPRTRRRRRSSQLNLRPRRTARWCRSRSAPSA